TDTRCFARLRQQHPPGRAFARRFPARSEELLAVEENGERAVIRDLDEHLGAEAAGGDADAERPQLLGDRVDEGLRVFGARRVDPARPAAFARVAEQSELAY